MYVLACVKALGGGGWGGGEGEELELAPMSHEFECPRSAVLIGSNVLLFQVFVLN